MKPERRLADEFQPQLSEVETSEMWEQIEAASASPPGFRQPPWRVAGGAATFLVVASAAAVLLFRSPTGSPVVGQVVQASALAPQELELPDGSKIELEAGARLRIAKFSPESAQVVLSQGAARFDVQRRGKRSFVVQAGGVEVAVVGTRFRVSVDELGIARGRVDVAVEHGSVEVRRPDGSAPVSLAAGERWTSALGVAVTSAVAPTGSEAAAPAAAAVPDVQPPSSAPSGRAGTPADSTPSASGLFEAANQARVAGRSREAAGLFDRLRRAYRSDPRAALAAFQLGRIRLDELGDARGAIEAINDALALGGGGSLRDDALARLVEAYERSGNVGACRKAKQAYLTGQPRGAHVGAVGQRCP